MGYELATQVVDFFMNSGKSNSAIVCKTHLQENDATQLKKPFVYICSNSQVRSILLFV